MARLGALLVLIALLAARPATAQVAAPDAGVPGAMAVVSPAAEHVSVTVYRAPARGQDEINRRLPQGYALVTETRRVHLPAGPATIRFEGVASGIFPETVIVRGLPAGVVEKNLDADLLSPRSLYDRSLGRAVMIRRTIRGRTVTEPAIIRSSAAGAAVLKTADGVEALGCSGLPEAIDYPALPPGLTPKPTLSIATDSPAAANATLTLSYLAAGFDWDADYVVTMRPDGRGADLFAWVTLASGDVTSFAGADAQVVAGRPERAGDDAPGFDAGALAIHCWPTGDAILAESVGRFAATPPPPPPPPPAPMMARAMDVVVTGSRKAVQEELGDLKLYRLPEPVTLAAKAQKQVAMLQREAVPLRVVYTSDVSWDDASAPRLTLRATNRADAGLGLPLPAGRVVVFEGGDRPVLAGDSALADKAVGEEVEIKLDAAPGIAATASLLSQKGRVMRSRLAVTSDRPWPIAFEAKFRVPAGTRVSGGRAIAVRDGVPVWRVEVPANGQLSLDYTVTRPRD